MPPFYVKAFPEYLRAAGYYTSNRAKTDYQFGTPFTIWDDLGAQAHWRNRADKSQPFFSVFNLEITHESRIFPSSPARKGKPLVTDAAKIKVPPYYPDTPAVREELARMYDNIADMDGQVAEILRQLEEDGLADNTIVFYWSDHGDGVPRAKRSLYDSGLRVPLMIRIPPRLGAFAAPGTVSDELVSFIDLAPTVLALAGLGVPAHMQGRVLVGPAKGPAPAYVFAARDRMDAEYDMMRSARDARFLYIRNFSPELPYAGHIIYRNQSAIMQEWLRMQAEGELTGPAALWMRTSRPPEELYDVRRDPHQIENIAADPGASRHARADAGRGRRVDDAHRRPGADQRARDDPADVAGRRAAGHRAALHRAAPDDRSRRRAATASRSPGRWKSSSTCRRRARRSATPPTRVRTPQWRLYTGADPRHRADDAARQGDPLRLQGERGDAGGVTNSRGSRVRVADTVRCQSRNGRVAACPNRDCEPATLVPFVPHALTFYT